LDELDARRPVPLLPMMAQHQRANMRDHLEAVQEVVAAIADSDFQKVATAAKRMGFSEAMGRMCEHMGAGAPGFTEQALRFHHTADEIAVAATKQDDKAVLTALSKTLRTCTSCHATYKQHLVASLPQ
jgi:cytochrome c556